MQLIGYSMMRRLALMAAVLLWAVAALAEPIGTAEVVDGTVTVSRASGRPLILANGSALEEGDTITTEKNSYVRIRFTDGSEMAIRPSSRFVVQRYRYDQARPAEDNFLLRVVKGGMRTLTGAIGKRGNENAYRIEGSTATIGIRGTEFVVRQCAGDCSVEGRREVAASPATATSKKKPAPAPLVVAGRLVSFSGEVQARGDGKSRKLAAGDPLYSGDTLTVSTPGNAALIFNDQTKMVLPQGSQYEVSSVRYTPEAPAQGSFLGNLARGGLRMVTGAIGKSRPENVTVQSVTATIGIRGTNYDLWCVPSGSFEQNFVKVVSSDAHLCDQGLLASTRDGEIEVFAGGSSLAVPAGRVAYVDRPGAAPMLLDALPPFLRDHPAPAPEGIVADMTALFGVDGRAMDDPGLYVAVKEGVVVLTQQNGESITLQRGETGFASASGGELVRLGSEPEFISRDPYMSELRVDPATCRAR